MFVMQSPSLGRLLAVLGLFVHFPFLEAKDPVQDFCRRWGHQTAVIDRRLYIDGGLLDWNPISQNPLNYSNTWLLYQDLDLVGQGGMPQLYANLSKNSTVPDVSGGVLWADDVNKVMYLYGGQYQNAPEPFSFWLYDALLDQWNVSNANSAQLNQVAYGAGATVDERAEGYYLGGYLNNQTTPGWNGPPLATSNLIKYDMMKNVFTNNTGPDDSGRAEGSMVFLPASDNGLLIYMGGVVDAANNGTLEGSAMSTIYVYDINSEKWYTQTATGQIPDMRRRFCAGATMADDRSSYNIYIYGGFGLAPNESAFDDVYILTLPSFTWIKWYSSQPGAGRPHGDLSCNVIDGSQMLIIGGWFPLDSDCDSANVWGTHNLNLGQDGPQDAQWDLFYPNITSYSVPPAIASAVGGGPTGGATMRAPSTGFNNQDLSVYFTRTPQFAARTATRPVGPTSTPPTPPPSGSKSSNNHIGAIVGGAVGGGLGVIALICLLLFFCRKKRPLPRRKTVRHELADTQPPIEIASTPAYPPEQKSEMSHSGGQSPLNSTSPDPNSFTTGTPISPYNQQQGGAYYPVGSHPPPNWAGQHPQQQSQYQPQYDPTQDVMRQQHYPPPPSQTEEPQPSRSPPTTTSTPAHFYPQPQRQTPRRSPQPGHGRFIEEEDGYDYRTQ